MSLLFRYLTKNNAMILLPTLAVGIGLYVLTDLFERLDNFIEARAVRGHGAHLLRREDAARDFADPAGDLPAVHGHPTVHHGSQPRADGVAGRGHLPRRGGELHDPLRHFLGRRPAWFLRVSGRCRGTRVRRIWQEEVRKKNLAATVLEDVWFTDGDWIVSLGTLDPQAHGTGFSGYELSDDGLSIKRIVQASTFTAEPSHWALQDVHVYTPDTFTQEQEPDFVLPLRQDPETFRLVSTGTKPQQLPLWQLGDAISQLKSSGSNVEALRTAWHAKLAYAASILVMAFVATAIVSWKDNIYIAVTVALLCTFLYFAVYTLGTTLGQRGILHPFLAAWTANLIALFFAFWRLIPLLLRRE